MYKNIIVLIYIQTVQRFIWRVPSDSSTAPSFYSQEEIWKSVTVFKLPFVKPSHFLHHLKSFHDDEV